jgi:hypothetical protein
MSDSELAVVAAQTFPAPILIERAGGWEVLRQAEFDSVRQVAIDDDWSALRFRRVEFIKQSKQ